MKVMDIEGKNNEGDAEKLKINKSPQQSSGGLKARKNLVGLNKGATGLPEIAEEDIKKSKDEERLLTKKVHVMDLIVKYGQKQFDVNSDPAIRKKFGTDTEKEIQELMKDLLQDKEIT